MIYKNITGEGQYIELSQFESTMNIFGLHCWIIRLINARRFALGIGFITPLLMEFINVPVKKESLRQLLPFMNILRISLLHLTLLPTSGLTRGSTAIGNYFKGIIFSK